MATPTPDRQTVPEAIAIPIGPLLLNGELTIGPQAAGLVIFVHGSGSSRHSPRNQYVARVLEEAGLGTLLFDLLTQDEEFIDEQTRELRFDINLLADRLVGTVAFLTRQESVRRMRIGLFGASTGGGAALVAAAKLGEKISAVVSRGGRPDLAGQALAQIKSPTLLLVGARDHVVIELNRQAYQELQCEKELKIIPGATHLFEEPGTLEDVARLAAKWFGDHTR